MDTPGLKRLSEAPHGYFSEEMLANLEYLDTPPPKRGRMHELILEDPISQLNVPPPIVLDAADPVSKAVRMMRKLRYGSILVKDGGQLAGIFTEKDLLRRCSGRRLDLERVALREVMTPRPQALTPAGSLAEALHLMAVGSYRHVPIVDDGDPVGFVSIRGILRYLADNAVGAS